MCIDLSCQWSWTTEITRCDSTHWCLEGDFIWNAPNHFECTYNIWDESEYNCAKWGDCPFDLEEALEGLAEALGEIAIENGLDLEYVNEWAMSAQSAWEELERSQQDRAEELAEQHAGEAAEMFAPVLDGMIGDLADAVNEGIEELREELADATMNGDDEDWVVLAEKTATKSHKHENTAAYVAGGITLAAAAIGAAYLLNKKRQNKSLNEALIND